MQFLRVLGAGTVTDLRIGPFVDSGDGNTEENELTIAYTDVLLSKNGAAFAAKHEDTSLTGKGAGGFYTCTLDSTDLNTAGRLQLKCHPTGALMVYHEYMVLPAVTYEGLITGAAFGTDYKPLISTDAQNLSGSLDVNTKTITGGAVNAAAIADNAIDNGTFAADTIFRNTHAGTASAAGASTITLAAGASTVNNYYAGQIVRIISATAGAGQTRVIKSYVGSTLVATLTEPWATTPTGTIVYVIQPAVVPQLGTDGSVLISANAQDLSASLNVDAKTLNGEVPRNAPAKGVF